MHHAWGTLNVESINGILFNYKCKKWKVENFAADLIITNDNDPDYATAQSWGGEVKPCGYPLLSGAT